MWGPGLVLSVFLLPTVSGCTDPDERDAAEGPTAPARQVTTVAVTERPFERVVAVTGTLAAEEQVVLAFKVAGQVGEVTVDSAAPCGEARSSPG